MNNVYAKLVKSMARKSLPLEISTEARQHPHWSIVERVASSQCFLSSARLRNFLFYVCDCALRNAPDEATEQHIGIHVFRRRPGYNSSDDSIVRTHARSLRQKLAEYFSGEGVHEEIVIFIPKGHYLPFFASRAEQENHENERNSAKGEAVHATDAEAHSVYGGWRWWLAITAVLSMAVIGVFLGLHFTGQSGVTGKFWGPFLGKKKSLLIYSNALFKGNSKDGLRYASPMDAQYPLPPGYVDDYTGTGELNSVYELTRLFDRYHSSFVLKRSLLVTWDQANRKNLIFIGSVAENPSLRAIPETREFTLTSGKGFSGIVNHHPHPGEPKIYKRPEYPLTRDYAILALLPGMQPGLKILIFSGLTTYGTQAAVEFACNRDDLKTLLQKVKGKNGKIRPFEAVLETSIVGGVPVKTHLVTVHIR